MLILSARQELCAASTRLVIELLEAKKLDRARYSARWTDADMGMTIVDAPQKADGKPARLAIQWSEPGVSGVVQMKLHKEYLDKLRSLYARGVGAQPNRCELELASDVRVRAEQGALLLCLWQ